MARLMAPMAKRLITLLDSYRTSDGAYQLPTTVFAEALMNLALEISGDELAFFPKADEVIWAVARHEGYIIPDYPLDSNSEVKSFLEEYEATNTTDWYIRHGLSIMSITHFWLYSCFMARNLLFWRKLFVFKASDVSEVNALAKQVHDALIFCLSEQTSNDDPRLFAV